MAPSSICRLIWRTHRSVSCWKIKLTTCPIDVEVLLVGGDNFGFGFLLKVFGSRLRNWSRDVRCLLPKPCKFPTFHVVKKDHGLYSYSIHHLLWANYVD